MEGVGNVVAVDDDSVIISSQGARHLYKIPKSNVEGYNGAEVFLDISVSSLHSFDVDNNNNNNNNNNPSPRKEDDAYSRSDATSAARPVITKDEQGLDKKQQKITTSRTSKEAKKEQPIRSENTIKGSESAAVSEIETSIESDKTLIQDNSNIVSAPPSSLINSFAIAAPKEEEAIQPREVKIKPPNNIEFNPPPTSAENLSTVHEVSGAGTTNGSTERTEKEHTKAQEEKLDEENKYLGSSSLVPPFTISVALWQQSMLYYIDIFNELAINAAKTTQYWFNALGNEYFEVE